LGHVDKKRGERKQRRGGIKRKKGMEGKKREHRCTWWKKRDEKNMCILKRKNDIGVILIPLPGRVSFFYISKTRKVFSIRILHLVCFII